MLERWIKAHRVGLAAYRLNLLKVSSHSRPVWDRRSVDDRVLTILKEEMATGSALYHKFTDTLPPVILKLLLSIPSALLQDSSLYDERDAWQTTLGAFLGNRPHERRNRTSRQVAARILAHHILHSTGNPKVILRLAKAIISPGWRSFEEDEDVLQSLNSALVPLRSSWENTQANLDAIEALGAALSKAHHWIDVENVLYQQMFCWPLVLPLGVFADRAISLPVGVDICFDDRSKETDEGVEIRGNGLIVTSRWEENLRKVARVARRMWRAKHGNYGSFRKKVEGVSVIFDFCVADQIVAGFPTRFTLSDASMEAYFSQVILSRLLGNSLSSSRIVTGEIGAPIKFGDYDFERPKAIPEKLRYVFMTRSFERLILPDIKGLPIENSYRRELRNVLQKYRREQSTEINFVNSLQNVADSFQSGGWRQFRYVRCPDISWRTHPDGARLPGANTKQVADCLDILRKNNDTVLELSEEVNPIHLAGALWHINTRLREQLPLNTRPPMISWTFLRAIAEEQDARFWQVVWRITGAPPREYDAFHQTATSQMAAQKVAEMMNCFTPSESRRSHRAPDLLVILGTRHFKATAELVKNPVLHIHGFNPIMEWLKHPGILQPILSPLMRDFLGNTRVITLRSEDVPDSLNDFAELPLGKMEEELLDSSVFGVEGGEQELLRCLSTFRFGFTQSMANVLWTILGYRELRVRDMLKLSVKKRFLRYGAGEYHFPGKIGKTWEPSGDRLEDARKHHAASIALAPYLLLYDIPGVPFDEAFQPQYVHEAAYHLRMARRLLDNPGDRFRRVIQSLDSRLLRFAEYPGWRSVRVMLRLRDMGKDAYELAMDLLNTRKDSASAPHPVQLITAAEAVENWWEEKVKNLEEKNKEYSKSLVEQIKELYEEAEQACDYPEVSSERDCNKLRVLTQQALFYEKHAFLLSWKESQDCFNRLNREAFTLLDAGTDGSIVSGKWYETVGDDIQNNKEAYAVYQSGIKWLPEFFPLWIKLIGSACLAFGDPTTVESIVRRMSNEQIESMFHFSLSNLNHDRKRDRPWVYARWKSFINFFLKIFGAEPRIQKHLSLYGEALARWHSPKSSRQR